jgi:hypothetical protein
MADELKELPSSPTAALLRRVQESAQRVAGDPSTHWWPKTSATVVDSLIGRAPEHLDDVASGMFTVKRPSAQESWVGANQPLVDAAGLAPVGGAAKASFLGAKMLKSIGRGDEYLEALDYYRRTKTPPAGWFLHPGSDATAPKLAKYEPQQYDPYTLRRLIEGLEDKDYVNYDAEDLLGSSDWLKAYNRTTVGGKGGRRLSVATDPDPSRTSLGTFLQKESKVVLRPRLLTSANRVGLDPHTALRETLGHELTHGAQMAEELPSLMRGANTTMYDPRSTPVMDWAAGVGTPSATPYAQTVGGKLAAKVTDQTPEEAINSVVAARLNRMATKGSKFDLYNANPGEAAARGIQRVEVARSRDPSMSEGMINRILAREMEQAHLQSRANPSISTIDEEMRTLLAQLRQQQRLKKGSP